MREGLFIGSWDEPMKILGLPPDGLAWLALIVGLGLLGWNLLRRADRPTLPFTPLTLALALATFAGVLSASYQQTLLGGVPRIIDASSYLLEARSIAEGSFTFPVVEPTAAFRGRFLLPSPDDATRLGVIFPPGYPTVLALAIRLGDYRLLGPLLAAAIVLATYWLGMSATRDRRVALLAAGFSVLSATLRFHTAETMSHGLSILLTTLALCATLQLITERSVGSGRTGTARMVGWAGLLGLILGWLLATRQLTGLLVSLACGFGLLQKRDSKLSAWAWLGLLLAALPGLGLLLAHQHALTGSVFESPQTLYYSLADGPLDCFGLGWGKGCHYEHADVVAEQGGAGLTLGWMARNTVYRLHWQSLDLANFEPFLLLSWWWLFRQHRSARARPLILATLLLPFGYGLFYFQGSFPGGGARFLVESLPVLQVALAAAVVSFGASRAALGLALIGFAVHGAYVHRAIPGAAASPEPHTRPGITAGLVDSDHAFNLLFDPGWPQHALRPHIARDTRDDRLLAFALPDTSTSREVYTFEAEADWPPRSVSSLWSMPIHLPDACVSGGRGLGLYPQPSGGRLRLELAGVPTLKYRVTAHVWDADRGCHAIDLGVLTLPSVQKISTKQLDSAEVLDRITARPTD